MRKTPILIDSDFTAFFKRNSAYVVRTARVLGAKEPEDIAQKVLLTALRRFPDFDPTRAKGGGNPERSWLRDIVRKKLANEHRKEAKAREVREWLRDLAPISRAEGQDPEIDLIFLDRLIGFLAQYPASWRAAFLCSQALGISAAEIGRTQDVSRATIRSRINTMKADCRSFFDQQKLIAVANAGTSKDFEQRSWALLVALAPLETAVPVAGVGAGKLSSLLKIGWAKLALGGALGVGVLGSVVVFEHQRAQGRAELDLAPPTPTRVRAKSTPRQGEATLASEPGQDAELDPDLEPLVITPSKAPKKPISPAKQTARLESPETKATQAVVEARALLVQGEAQAALDRLGPAAGSSNPRTQRNHLATRVSALCQLGQTHEAEALIQGWSASHPGVFTQEQLQHPCDR